MKTFDPNSAAEHDGIFGLPYSEKESQLIFIPVPWEATTSYGSGTSKGPQSILNASYQLDLFDSQFKRPYEAGMNMLPINKKILSLNSKAKKLANNKKPNVKLVNKISSQINDLVYKETKKQYKQNKIVSIIGGDHSTPLGAFKAASEEFGNYGILHFDAHSDTRKAFSGFTYSHASIMYNALTEISQISTLTQVGIRDYCEEEVNFIQNQKDRINLFTDLKVQEKKIQGMSFSKIAEDIIETLPNQVWVSFDIDGLDPKYCPNTGTPVPGGLEYSEVVYILYRLAISGKRIIGFDLVEVAPDPKNSNEWDANVGMRLLYKMAACCLYSQNKIKLTT